MKLPVLWIAAAFAAGIARASHEALPPKAFAIAALSALLLSAILLWRRLVEMAWPFALVTWFALGGLAFGVEQNSIPTNHVTRLIAAGQLETSAALRWRGRLREDPLTLPWGRRYEIDLEGVESASVMLPVSGGLRANLYGESHLDEAPQGLRAGDRVEALLRAQPPRNFLDPGAFDLRGYLAGQKIDVTGSLRSGELLTLIDRPRPSVLQRLARARGNLFARLDSLFAAQPKTAAVLRAMLLGDRSFVDSDVVTAFQKTAAYHVLVVAGLHVGALVVFLFWLCRRMRFSIGATSCVTLIVLGGYVGVVQDRPPILRAALMAGLYLCSRPLFRRVDLLNTVALAALVILLWKPSSLGDSTFQLSFLAAGVIAALALPWMDRTSALYRGGLAHLGDVTRDAMHPPKVAQFRIDLRGFRLDRSAIAAMARAPLAIAVDVSGLDGPAIVGNCAAFGGDSVGHDAASGPRFSPCEPGRPGQQHSSRDSHRADCAPRFPCARVNVCLEPSSVCVGKNCRIVGRIVARHCGMVQPSAARFLPNSRAARVARFRIFRGIGCTGGNGARTRRALFESDCATATTDEIFCPGMGRCAFAGGADDPGRFASIRADTCARRF